ncbi:ribonuclease H-like domain-containing protein [Tanacetum coccineum]
MGDENPIRTLGDYSKPSHEDYRNTIELPVGNNVCEIDCAADGKLRDKNTDKSWEIIENLALYVYEGWNDTKEFTELNTHPQNLNEPPKQNPFTFRERTGPNPQPQALGTTFEARVRDYMAEHTERMERFENAIFKQREEINDIMTEMFGLLKELATRRAPEKAGCPTTRRSTSGHCVFLGNNLLSWSSKRQSTLSRSSAEAEYLGVANDVVETCWLRNLLHELYTPLSSATLVYYDNVSVVYLSSNPVQHQRTKHIEIDIHFVRDLVASGHVCVLHVPSRYQYADIFTKGLPSALFEEFRTSLSVHCYPALTAGEFGGGGGTISGGDNGGLGCLFVEDGVLEGCILEQLVMFREAYGDGVIVSSFVNVDESEVVRVRMIRVFHFTFGDLEDVLRNSDLLLE